MLAETSCLKVRKILDVTDLLPLIVVLRIPKMRSVKNR